MILLFITIAAFIIFYMNKLMDAFCTRKEIPDNKQDKIFQTANISTLILLISSFVELLFLH